MATTNKGIKSLWGYPLIDNKARNAISDTRSTLENDFQKKTDDTLTTNNKTIVGSINEVAAQCKDISKNLINENYLILKSPNGTIFKLKITNDGNLSISQIPLWSADFNNKELYNNFNIQNNNNLVYSENNILHIKSKKNSSSTGYEQPWVETQGILEMNNGAIEFEAKFSNLQYAWNYIITYGQGCWWDTANSSGIMWPASGEVDCFEQSPTANTDVGSFTSVMHYGSASRTNYPKSHLITTSTVTNFDPNSFHKFKVEINNGVWKCYLDNVLVSTLDGSNCVVNNPYVYNYYPFKRPMAWYMQAQCHKQEALNSNIEGYEMLIKSINVYGNPSKATDISFECSSADISQNNIMLPKNESIFIQANVLPVDYYNKACKWKSDNNSIATVKYGFITGVSEGECNITCTLSTDSSISKTFSVSVNDSATYNCLHMDYLSDTDNISLNVEETSTPTIYRWPTFTTDVITYKSTDDAIATYIDGTITAKKSGECAVKAICNNIVITKNIKVIEKNTPLLMYDFSNNNYNSSPTITNTGNLGNTYDLNCTNNGRSQIFVTNKYDDIIIPAYKNYMLVIKDDGGYISDGTNKNELFNLCCNQNKDCAIGNAPSVYYSAQGQSIAYGYSWMSTTTDNTNLLIIGYDGKPYVYQNDKFTNINEDNTDYLKNIVGIYMRIKASSDKVFNGKIGLFSNVTRTSITDIISKYF